MTDKAKKKPVKKLVKKPVKKKVSKGRGGYSLAEKAKLLDTYFAHRETMNADEAAKKTGISYITLNKWSKAAKPKKKKAPARATATGRGRPPKSTSSKVMAEFTDEGIKYTLIKIGKGFELQKIETVAKFGK